MTFPQARCESGAVLGGARDERGVVSFKGIPYAAPPVGELRWRGPQAAEPWEGVRDATQFGARCYSAWVEDQSPGPPRSEDCLTLNVWTPAQAPGEKRPVMVWVHGGGFQFGSSAERMSDGALLAAGGVVVVSFNYRVGVFGFLAHPELDAEGPSGNYGLQDQLAALRWVQNNVAAFGGDPNNVTVFGESAGAHAIGILMASPLAKGLMHKAIGESGAFWDGGIGSLATFAEAHALGTALAGRLGAPSIAALRALPAEALHAATPWNFDTNPITTAFSPNIDGYVVPDVPAARFARGEALRIPLLAGWNDAEYWPFDEMGLPHATPEEFRAAAERLFGASRIAEFLALYPAQTGDEAKRSAEALVGDLTISEQTWQWLDLQRKVAPAYGYFFSYTSPYVPVASHLVEVPFVFGTLTPQFIIGSMKPPEAADRALSETMRSYWVNFATSGDPNGPGLPRWPKFDGTEQLLEFGTAVAAQPNAQAARFRFLGSYRREGALPIAWREAFTPPAR